MVSFIHEAIDTFLRPDHPLFCGRYLPVRSLTS